jgi:hypothetical protein
MANSLSFHNILYSLDGQMRGKGDCNPVIGRLVPFTAF